jgi:hypothetical protein
MDDTKKILIRYVDADVLKDLKRIAVENDTSMNTLLLDLIGNYVSSWRRGELKRIRKRQDELLQGKLV